MSTSRPTRLLTALVLATLMLANTVLAAMEPAWAAGSDHLYWHQNAEAKPTAGGRLASVAGDFEQRDAPDGEDVEQLAGASAGQVADESADESSRPAPGKTTVKSAAGASHESSHDSHQDCHRHHSCHWHNPLAASLPDPLHCLPATSVWPCQPPCQQYAHQRCPPVPPPNHSRIHLS